jgi:uncharacterized membrane protein
MWVEVDTMEVHNLLGTSWLVYKSATHLCGLHCHQLARFGSQLLLVSKLSTFVVPEAKYLPA